jgi:hypothetical protein
MPYEQEDDARQALRPTRLIEELPFCSARRVAQRYAAEAHARKETYTFTDPWGMPRTWLRNK